MAPKVIELSTPLRPARGSAEEDEPQYSLVHEEGLKLENATFRPPESPALAAPEKV
jgi:hypothetical protein